MGGGVCVLIDLDAFYTEHRSCGDVRGGVEDHDDGEVIWFECECSARITRPVPEDDIPLSVDAGWCTGTSRTIDAARTRSDDRRPPRPGPRGAFHLAPLKMSRTPWGVVQRSGVARAQ